MDFRETELARTMPDVYQVEGGIRLAETSGRLPRDPAGVGPHLGVDTVVAFRPFSPR
jgi:hypothetical protein